MSDQGQAMMRPLTRYDRWRRTRVHRLIVRWLVWRGTERVASRVARWTHAFYDRPGYRWSNDWTFRWIGGLYLLCHTHICGHGLRYAFDVACIHWAPRYAKRRLRLPDPR